MSIDLVMPSRGRPDRLRKTLESVIDTATTSGVQVFVRVDDDDSETLGQLDDLRRLAFDIFVGPRLWSQGAMWNECAERGDGHIVGMCADDMVFRTKGWDARVEQEFAKCPDEIVLVYCDDGIQHGRIAVHSFVSRTSIRVLGTYLSEAFHLLYVDTWLDEVYGNIGRKVFMPDVLIEHEHFSAHPELWDKTYSEPREGDAKKVARAAWASTAWRRRKDERVLMQYIADFARRQK